MKILICGDYFPNLRINEMVDNGDYSFMDGVKPLTSSVDYSIINFEGPVAEGKELIPIKKTGPNLRCGMQSMEAVKYAGFDCVTFSNNHFYDYGEEGVRQSISAAQKNGLQYVGGGTTLDDAKKILYCEIKGKTIAILNYCEHEWSIATKKHGGSNPLDVTNNYYDIQAAKSKSDYVLAIIHGGVEHYQLPTPRMQKNYRFFIDAGADAVINCHQHCFSGWEVWHEKPIFYGLGNFCFDRDVRHITNKWSSGFAVCLNLEEKISFELFPYQQCTINEPYTMIEVDENEFNNNMNKLNDIISDEGALEDSFKSLCKEGYNTFGGILSPWQTKIGKIAAGKGLLPKLCGQNRKRLFQAFVMCESHRERLLCYLSQIIEH